MNRIFENKIINIYIWLQISISFLNWNYIISNQNKFNQSLVWYSSHLLIHTLLKNVGKYVGFQIIWNIVPRSQNIFENYFYIFSNNFGKALFSWSLNPLVYPRVIPPSNVTNILEPINIFFAPLFYFAHVTFVSIYHL